MHATLKAEREGLEVRLKTRGEAEASWETRYAELNNRHTELQAQLATTNTEQGLLARAKASVEAQLTAGQQDIARLQGEVSRVTSEHITSMRQLQSVQTELRAAIRRAD